MISFTDLNQQYREAKTDIDSAIARVIESGNFITGSLTEEFENKFKQVVNAEACASTGSGTVSLMCALMACGISSDDEVITTPNTFISTSEAILWQGAKPVYVDIDSNYQIDVNKIEEKITPKTKAILFVDIYGQTPDIAKLKEIATKHNLFLIEDAAHSYGSFYNGMPVGGLVDLTCFSFNPLKNLGAMGDAGAVTGRKDLIDRVKIFRDHGRAGRWNFDNLGINGRIDNMQSEIVLAKIPYAGRWIAQKRKICQRYTAELKDYVITPEEYVNSYHTYYVYAIQVPNRDEFVEYMKQNAVMVNVHYAKSLTKQPIFANEHSCPIAEQVCNNIVSLPCYHNLSIESQDKIIDLIKLFCNTK
jgi:UDP-2-acetamido-2-deoxy-ribo-hexuluronate aminotransferase